VSLVSRVRKLFHAAVVGSVLAIVDAAPASAADNIKCQNTWANAVKPVVDNVTGGLVGLFAWISVPALIVVLVLLAFLHGTRHRAVLVSTIGILFMIAIGIIAGPTILETFTQGVCR
jgi:hypothetical protein